MSEKSLFFNALPNDKYATGYDRNYNADDISDWLAVIWENGVVKSNMVDNEATGLKVVAATNMTVNLKVGRAAIKGKAYVNTAIKSFTIAANGTNANRYDYIVLRYNNNTSERKITAELKTGSSEIPTVSSLTRTDNIYELMLCYITVAPAATSISQTNITDTRGKKDLCPWFTAVKGYNDYYDAIITPYEYSATLNAAYSLIATDIPSNLYNSKYSLVDVYINGVLQAKSTYNLTTTTNNIIVNFASQKAANSQVIVRLSNFMDGEGLSTAISEYTKFTKAVADLQTKGTYDYVCTGVDDNIKLSKLVDEFLTTADIVDAYRPRKITVLGELGITTPAGTSSAATNPDNYWFNWNTYTLNNRKIIIDFSNCSTMQVPIESGKKNIIFNAYGNTTIIGANIIVNNTAADTVVRVFELTSEVVKCEDCRFYITAYKDSYIAPTGTFNNCRGSVANATGNSYCFNMANNGLLRVNGGEYYAYTGENASNSAVVGQSGTEAVSILYGVNAPTLARSNYYQKNSILQLAGGGVLSCTDLVSALAVSVISGISNIRGTIAKSKAGLM